MRIEKEPDFVRLLETKDPHQIFKTKFVVKIYEGKKFIASQPMKFYIGPEGICAETNKFTFSKSKRKNFPIKIDNFAFCYNGGKKVAQRTWNETGPYGRFEKDDTFSIQYPKPFFEV